MEGFLIANNFNYISVMKRLYLLIALPLLYSIEANAWTKHETLFFQEVGLTLPDYQITTTSSDVVVIDAELVLAEIWVVRKSDTSEPEFVGVAFVLIAKGTDEIRGPPRLLSNEVIVNKRLDQKMKSPNDWQTSKQDIQVSRKARDGLTKTTV